VAYLDSNANSTSNVAYGAAWIPGYGQNTSLGELLEKYEAQMLVVAQDPHDSLDPKLLREILQYKVRGMRVSDMPTLYKKISGKVPIYNVSDMWFLLSGGFDIPSRPVLRNTLRLFDIATALIGLAITLPIWPVIALMIKLETGGPVLYRQKRVGLWGRPFEVLKFRTMPVDAEINGPQWASGPTDPRVTRVGRILRRTRLDEIPQFIQILKGEMSLIGPRPERPEFVEKLKARIPFYELRFAVRPGLTGWAQVNFGYGASVEDAAVKLQYDLYYIQENSLLLNLRIIFRTIRTILFARGS
jgi:exopolysaccharide biosynthesis polyprenyl glycosylphosphotransferase